MWSPTLKEECKSQAFENIMHREMLGYREAEASKQFKILHYKLPDLYRSHSVIIKMK
jgi:hypothetical protein